ncbi:MAG TPA: HAD-IA family hydrolase [Candidatus Acidoferrales bacterium]|nr:HAD-IA family hydrolase [Candidatus Acidoferrales bacterium]
MVKAAIFDMDGLIIDSEPLWEESYVEPLVRLGVPRAEITKPENKGRGAREFFKHWFVNYPWGDSPTVEELINKTTVEVEKLIRKKGKILPGVLDAFKLLQSRSVPMAVSSSSPLNLIEATVDTLHIREYFSLFHTGADEEFAKPHPAVFIHTAKEMEVEYSQCLVFEDSLSGVIAAKAAQMKCVAVPAKVHRSDPRYCIADKTLDSLTEFNISILQSI